VKWQVDIGALERNI